MPARRAFLLLAAIFFGIAAFFFPASPGHRPRRSRRIGRSVARARVHFRRAFGFSTLISQLSTSAGSTGGSPIADALNAANGKIRRDLEILDELFGAFHTNFPRLGNPVGENVEIAAALTGENPAKFVFISPRHRAINARGELCDRWGTPFRFHQVSGTQMEIRSAGPDRKFATPDDALFP